MDREGILKLAELAKLHVNDESLDEVANSINNVIALVDQLKAANISDVEPMAHPLDAIQVLREDVVNETDEHEKFQAIAPATEDALYLVPKVID